MSCSNYPILRFAAGDPDDVYRRFHQTALELLRARVKSGEHLYRIESPGEIPLTLVKEALLANDVRCEAIMFSTRPDVGIELMVCKQPVRLFCSDEGSNHRLLTVCEVRRCLPDAWMRHFVPQLAAARAS